MKILEVKNMCKSFKSKRVLEDINFTIDKGDILGYIGPNGAGKTTTIKAICGINTIDKGDISIKDDLGNTFRTSVVFDFNGLYSNMTAYENLLFFMKLSNIDKSKYNEEITKILQMVNLVEYKNSLVKTFSKGMKRRLVIGRAIINNPNILILDEPFDGLDVENHYFTVKFLKEWVNKECRCILFTSHNMKEVEEICNKVIIIRKGKIITSSTLDRLKLDNTQYIVVKLCESINDMQLQLVEEEFRDNMRYEKAENILKIYPNNYIDSKNVIKFLSSNNIEFSEVSDIKQSLEEIYMKKVNQNESAI